MPSKKLKEYLDSNKILYVSITHSPAYTAQAVAESVHIPGKEMAKTVIVKIDGIIAMAVLPAKDKINFEKLRDGLKTKEVTFPLEKDFKDRFTDCELGAMPPFGNLYNMKVIVSRTLAEDDIIAFNACSHTEVVKMHFKDFERLVNPTIVDFT
jgi:Ala-tRNA(Pro) deacylase